MQDYTLGSLLSIKLQVSHIPSEPALAEHRGIEADEQDSSARSDTLSSLSLACRVCESM